MKFGKGRRWRNFAANCGMLIIMEELDAALGPFSPVLTVFELLVTEGKQLDEFGATRRGI